MSTAVGAGCDTVAMAESEQPTDLAWGAFSDQAPWVLDREAVSWRSVVDGLRRDVRAELPELIVPGRPPVRRLLRTSRLLGTAVGGWLIRRRSLDASERRRVLAHRLRLAAERLGPTYIKLGQIISSGQGLFPPELVEEFALCRDRVAPESFAAVRAVIEEDLGASIEELFEQFDRRPLAAASIAQVHRAVLRSGEEVVVKVQRPSVASRVREDLRVMSWLAPFLVGRIPIAALANPPALVDLFGESITEELEFRMEAENMIEVAASLRELDQSGYVVPRPHPELVTRRVLVMERFEGFDFDDVVGMRDAGIDTEAVVKTGMVMFLEGMMFNGIFHGDLHFGNLLVLEDGRTGLLDFGIVARLDERERTAFLRLLVSATMNDISGQMVALRDLGALPPDADLDAIISDLGLDQAPVDPLDMDADALTAEVQRVVKALLGYGARLPKPLMLFVKNLVFLDGAITTLAPDLDLLAEITEIAMYFTTRHGARIVAEVGLGAEAWDLDLTGVQAGLGASEDSGAFTHRELRKRRQVIADRMEAQRSRGERAGRRRGRLLGRRRRSP